MKNPLLLVAAVLNITVCLAYPDPSWWEHCSNGLGTFNLSTFSHTEQGVVILTELIKEEDDTQVQKKLALTTEDVHISIVESNQIEDTVSNTCGKWSKFGTKVTNTVTVKKVEVSKRDETTFTEIFDGIQVSSDHKIISGYVICEKFHRKVGISC